MLFLVSQVASSLRQVWRTQLESHGYLEYQEQWNFLLRHVSVCAPLFPFVNGEKQEVADMEAQPGTPDLPRLNGVFASHDLINVAEAMQID